MDYFINNKMHKWSYKELKDLYIQYCELPDIDFIKQLPKIIHFACFVSWIKEIAQEALSDEGIVHQLSHLLSGEDIELADVRKLFAEVLELK